jgi:hypothetical protein
LASWPLSKRSTGTVTVFQPPFQTFNPGRVSPRSSGDGVGRHADERGSRRSASSPWLLGSSTSFAPMLTTVSHRTLEHSSSMRRAWSGARRRAEAPEEAIFASERARVRQPEFRQTGTARRRRARSAGTHLLHDHGPAKLPTVRSSGGWRSSAGGRRSRSPAAAVAGGSHSYKDDLRARADLIQAARCRVVRIARASPHPGAGYR